ncbi:beta-galactosidase [Natronoflexus pectinivorans]|nr:beta-galactosidase [Natronoflexus pectinivorans]
MKNKLLIILFLFLLSFPAWLMSGGKYHIDLSGVNTEVLRGHLDLGGRSISGEIIDVNSFYIERNGEPYIPVIAEFHYSRYPREYWDEQIKKIKAGGVTVVASYVFWNLHEFKEGEFDWSGNLDLRHFVELCGKNGLDVIVRIGPFAHGEMRNGGLPDWLYGRPIEVRSNDPAYLYYVNRLYHQIGDQLSGLMFKDNGPIIGIQIENEYQHSAAPWAFTYQGAPRENTVARRDVDITQIGVGVNEFGNEFAGLGRDHMKTLKMFAIEAGMETPIYTATGWGYATIVEKGSIPVMAGYAYPFWVPDNRPSPFYLFKNIHKNPDYSPVSYDVNLYPSMAAELGTGIAVTYSRRPRVPGESFLPMMVRTVGSGTNGLGFYMYHGGTTPSIGNFFMTEGFGLANKSYDYQSPIGEFGKTSKGYYPLKLINYFLQGYGNVLAPFYPVLPESNESISPDNTETLRYAIRTDGMSGFIFMHNFQDRIAMPDHRDLHINVNTIEGTFRFPHNGTFTLKSEASGIFPFNLDFDGVFIHQATAQPFMRFENDGRVYHVMVAIEGFHPQLVLNGDTDVSGTGIKTELINGRKVVSFPDDRLSEMVSNDVSFLVIPYEMALKAWLTGKAGNQHLIISNALVLEDEKSLSLISDHQTEICVRVYPAIRDLRSGEANVNKLEQELASVSGWILSIDPKEPVLQLIPSGDRHFVLRAEQLDMNGFNDVFITFDYRGDRAVCMMNGELMTDHLYTSAPWTIGLKRYVEMLKDHEMYFYFIPMRSDAPYLSWLDEEVIPDFGERREFLEIKEPEISVEYRIDIMIEKD